jgi:hypothetical protein
MEINQFTQELIKKMDQEIDRISLDEPNKMKQLSLIIASIERRICELKDVAITYAFRDNCEEISFFKESKPEILSRLYFYQHLRKVAMLESFATGEKKKGIGERYLGKLNRYYQENRAFYNYVLSGDTSHDEIYFRRSESNLLVDGDNRFSTGYDVVVARLLAAERAGEALKQKMNERERDRISSDLRWTGSKTDLIELLYALHACDVFNKGNADMKKIASTLETVFHVSLGNYYRTFQEIRLRKRGQASFIEKLRAELLKRAEEFDE